VNQPGAPDITSSAEDPDDIESVSVGYFRFKERRGAPWKAVKVMRESGRWIVLVNGEVVPGSGARLAKDIGFLLWRAPFHPISDQEYDAILRAHKQAPAGHPLRNPDEKVDVRSAPPLYTRKQG
jgi:hypothetical protein